MTWPNVTSTTGRNVETLPVSDVIGWVMVLNAARVWLGATAVFPTVRVSGHAQWKNYVELTSKRENDSWPMRKTNLKLQGERRTRQRRKTNDAKRETRTRRRRQMGKRILSVAPQWNVCIVCSGKSSVPANGQPGKWKRGVGNGGRTPS